MDTQKKDQGSQPNRGQQQQVNQPGHQGGQQGHQSQDPNKGQQEQPNQPRKEHEQQPKH